MVWFDGTITEAINKAKAAGKVILIVITEEEESSNLLEVWSNEELINICSKECVCLKLKSTSESGKQFGKFYPVLFTPSAFLIGNNGKPIHILPGPGTAEDLIEKIQDSVTQNKSSASGSNLQHNEAAPNQSELSEDDKKKREQDYRNKIEERRLQKLQEEQKKRKKEELERRRLGKAMQDFAEEQRKTQMMEAIAERKKDQELEKKARQEVLRKIQQDRADQRQNRQSTSQNKIPSSSQPVKKEKTPITDICLQYRFLDGSTLVRKYDLDATLGEAVVDLRAEAGSALDYNFQLSILFSKTIFTEEDYSKKLSDLGLYPRCSVSVVPKKSTSKGIGVGEGTAMKLFGYLFFLLTLPLQLVRNLYASFFTSGTTTSNSDKIESKSETKAKVPSDPKSNASGLRKRHVGGETPKRNIHGLHDNKDSDDENATWNGNSTQQM